jgi:choline dehydrogenase-like flavoprotein
MYINNISKYFIYKNTDGSSMRVIITDSLDIIIQSDQIPNINSKIELTDTKDGFNNSNILLTHKAYEEDFERIIKCYNDLDAELKKNNLGYIHDIPSLEDIKISTRGASHHMGTTRFGKNKNEGVVDYNFKVFGLDNVYI